MYEGDKISTHPPPKTHRTYTIITIKTNKTYSYNYITIISSCTVMTRGPDFMRPQKLLIQYT